MYPIRRFITLLLLMAAFLVPRISEAKLVTSSIALGSPGAATNLETFSTDPNVPKTITYAGGLGTDSVTIQASLDATNYVTVAVLPGSASRTVLYGSWRRIRTSGAAGLTGRLSISAESSLNTVNESTLNVSASGASATQDFSTLANYQIAGLTAVTRGGTSTCKVLLQYSDDSGTTWNTLAILQGASAWTYVPEAASVVYRGFNSGGTCSSLDLAFVQTTPQSSGKNTAIASFTASGTTATNSSTTITGTNTLFTMEVSVGDSIALSSAGTTFAHVTAIASNTSLTVDAALGDGSTQTIIVQPPVSRNFDTTGALQSVVDPATGIIVNPAHAYGIRRAVSRVIDYNKPVAAVDCTGAALNLTVAQFLDSSIFTCGSAQTITFPSWQGASGIVQNLPGTPAVGDIVTVKVASTAAANVTIAAGTGGTFVGNNVFNNYTDDVTCRITSVTPGSETATCY